MAESYKKANRFIDTITVAQAAVEWQGLRPAQEELVTVEEGLPYLAGVPELSERAEAILYAANDRQIRGLTHNEDGYPLRTEAIRLDKRSVLDWIESVDSSPVDVAPPPTSLPTEREDELLKFEEVLAILKTSKSSLYRAIAANEFDEAHFRKPNRWRKSYVMSMIARVESSEIDL